MHSHLDQLCVVCVAFLFPTELTELTDCLICLIGFAKSTVFIDFQWSQWLAVLSNALKGLYSSSIGIGDVSIGYT